MTLLERINARLCREPGCKRAPAYPDQAYCEAHRVRWRFTPKDYTRSAA